MLHDSILVCGTFIYSVPAIDSSRLRLQIYTPIRFTRPIPLPASKMPAIKALGLPDHLAPRLPIATHLMLS